MNDGLAASIHARLLRRAKEHRDDFSLLLNRYATERFLYRLSQSPARENFWLKGAMLLSAWFDIEHRPTRDADFLGFGSIDPAKLGFVLREICMINADDGLVFDPGSISVEDIREDTRYGGLRAHLAATLGNARCKVQIDVGYGDAVTPGPQDITLPTLLPDQPAPSLRVYPRASVVAEKLEAIVHLGMGNSRMKDYFDLRALAQEDAIDPEQLIRAIAATFQRRGTAVPDELPIGLTEEFALDPLKQRQWSAFLRKNGLTAPGLEQVVADVRGFLAVPLQSARGIKGKP